MDPQGAPWMRRAFLWFLPVGAPHGRELFGGIPDTGRRARGWKPLPQELAPVGRSYTGGALLQGMIVFPGKP